MLLLSPLKTSELPEELPPLLEGCKPLLNQTEFVPDFDVPTNESYSSIIDQFSLPGILWVVCTCAIDCCPLECSLFTTLF